MLLLAYYYWLTTTGLLLKACYYWLTTTRLLLQAHWYCRATLLARARSLARRRLAYRPTRPAGRPESGSDVWVGVALPRRVHRHQRRLVGVRVLGLGLGLG